MQVEPTKGARYTRPMAILIGVDEAGYGPNYGPLAIAATAWCVAEGFRVQGSGFKKKVSGVRSQGSANDKRAGGEGLASETSGVDVGLFVT